MFQRNVFIGYEGDVTTGKIQDGRQQPYLLMDQNQSQAAQLDHQGNILDKYRKNPVSGLVGDALTRCCLQTDV